MNLKNYILLLLGIIVSATVVIVTGFIILNVCLKKKAAKYKAKSRPSTTTSYEMARAFHSYNDQDVKPPPLPSRQQFETESCHSYEEVEPPPSSPKEPVQSSLRQPQNTTNHHDTRNVFRDDKSVSESYDDVDALEQNGALSYNLKEPVKLSPPRLQSPIRNVGFQDDRSVSENYDDVDEIEQSVRYSHDDHASLPEYVDLEDDRNSPDSYDDIGELAAESEDYDDLV